MFLCSALVSPLSSELLLCASRVDRRFGGPGAARRLCEGPNAVNPVANVVSRWASHSVRLRLSNSKVCNSRSEKFCRLSDGLSAVCLSSRSKKLLNETHNERTAIRPPSGGSASSRSPQARYLVDPASSHMLVSKIKPCMSKYKPH